MDLIFGCRIASVDSWVGTLDGVWLDVGGTVEGLVIKRGSMMSRRYVASSDSLKRTDAEGCYLDLSTEAALALPKARETYHDATIVVLSEQSRLTLETGLRLRLAGVRVATNLVVTHLLAQRQWPANVVRLVPIEAVTEISPWRFSTEMSIEDFRELPRYRPDRDVKRAVREAIFVNEDVSDVDLNAVDLAVNGGTVTIMGNVRWPDTARDIEKTARSVQGVIEVDNRMANDRDIELRIASLIADIDSVLADSTEINSQLGDVTITGKVSGTDVPERMEEVVSGTAGVQGVTLCLTVAGPLAAIASASEPGTIAGVESFEEAEDKVV